MGSINNKVTKETLIKIIAETNHRDVATVKAFYNTFEQTIFDLLSSVDEENPISIRLFEGISLDGTFIPAQEKKNNLTGKMNFIDSKIKPKFNITRTYCEKLNIEK